MVAAAIGGSAVVGLIGSGISASGAQSAAAQQAAAANQAAQLEQQRYEQTRADLQPYNQAGQTDLPQLQNQWQTTQAGLTNAFNTAQAAVPGSMTQAQLLNTPGYAFNLDQGLKATQNAQAAKGLGISGAAMKQGANYATGLAQNTYQQQFNIAQAQYQDQNQQFQNANQGYTTVFNQLYSPASLGENAAAQTGSVGANLGIAQGNQIAAAGQALAAGTGTAAGAYAQGLQGVGNAGVTAALLAGNNALNPAAGNLSGYGANTSDYTEAGIAPGGAAAGYGGLLATPG